MNENRRNALKIFYECSNIYTSNIILRRVIQHAVLSYDLNIKIRYSMLTTTSIFDTYILAERFHLKFFTVPMYHDMPATST